MGILNKIIRPFKTKRILHILPNRQITYEIPFIGEIRIKQEIIEKYPNCKKTGDCRGQHYECLIVDESFTPPKYKMISTPLGNSIINVKNKNKIRGFNGNTK